MTQLPLLISFGALEALERALSSSTLEEQHLRRELFDRGLPVVTGYRDLAVQFGYSTSFIGAMANRPSRFYRTFQLRSGKKTRTINAPRVALKLIQQLVGMRLGTACEYPAHVHGFLPGKSTITAAQQHTAARWLLSVDIRDYFGSVTKVRVFETFVRLGYRRAAAHLLTDLCTLHGSLPQGSPASPALSNLAFEETDKRLEVWARDRSLRVTRYADDICVSGTQAFDEALRLELPEMLQQDGWQVAPEKTTLNQGPRPLQIHGLRIVDGRVRLGKRYRNRVRGMKHRIERDGLELDEERRLRGHIAYAAAVEPDLLNH